jgi:hypothetical protein
MCSETTHKIRPPALTASIVAPNVIVLKMKNATQYPKRGEEDAGEDGILLIVFFGGVCVFCFFCLCFLKMAGNTRRLFGTSKK